MHAIYTVFSSELIWLALKWLFIAGTWLVLAFGIFEDSRRLKTLHPASELTHMLQGQHQRNLQICIVLSLILLMDAASDLRSIIPLPKAENTGSEPVISASPTPAMYPTPTQSPLPYSDITEFNEKDGKREAYLDDLKQRYEAWLVTFYYIQKCGQANKADFEIIRNALNNELDRTHADRQIAENIISAAIGSYQEMYKDIPCDKANLEPSKATYDANMQRLQTPATPPLKSPTAP